MNPKSTTASRHLGTTLTLAFVAMSVAALVVSGVVGIIFLIQTQKEAIASKQHVVANQAADAVAGFIQKKFVVMEAAMRLTGSDRERKNALQALLGMEPAFRQLLLLNTGNEELFRASRMSRAESRRLDEQLGADPFSRISNGQRHIGAVYVDQVTSEPLVILSVPVTTLLGDRLGALLAEVNLKFIWQLVDRLRVGETGHAYVVDRKGRLIAFGETGRVLRGETLAHLRDVADFIDHPEKRENIDVHSFIGITGKEVVGTYVPLGDPDWAVMTELPVVEAYQPVIRNGLISIIVLLCISALAGWLGIFLARRLATPIVDLTRTAARITDGQLDVRAKMNGPTEVIHLSAAFNQMTRQLGVMLDQEAERTRALEQEISKRKTMEGEVRRNERMLRRIMDIVPSMIFAKNADGRFLMANQAIADSLSMTVDELVGRLHQDVHPDPDQVAQMLADDRKAMDSGKTVFIVEEPYTDSNGATRWLQTIKVPCDEDEFGEPAIVGLAMDITERKQMEQTLKENEERLKDLVSNVPGVVYQYKADPSSLSSSKLTSVIRDRVIEMFGLDSEMENFFNEFIACLPENDRARFPMSIKDALETVEPWHYEGRFTKPSGETLWFEGNSVPRRVGDELIYYGVLTDITQRKEMESSLRLARYIIDKADIAIFVLGENGEFLEVNEQVCRYLGYSREELGQMSIFDVDTLFTPEGWKAHMADLRSHGVKTLETLNRHKTGRVFPVQVIDNIMTFEDREFHVAFVQDITERKQAEAALQENEQLLANILESMNEGVIVLDHEFRYQIFNTAIERITNTPKQEVLGKRPWDAFAFIQGSVVEENMRNTMRGKGQGTMEIQLSLPHKHDAWFRESYTPLKDADGQIVGVIEVVSDITRQKQGEEEVRRLRNYLSNIIDSMPSILVAVDRKGRVTQWNRQAEQATGLTFEDARNRPLAEVFPRLADEMERVGMAIRECRVIGSPKIARKVEQEIRYEDITIFPLVANSVEGAVIRVDDVTQKVRLEEMMIQSEKMLSVGGLAAGMAHEINNPLAGIVQSASVLENRLLGDLPANHKAADTAGTTMTAIKSYLTQRRLPDLIGNIRESGSRAATIVRNMLSFARKSEKVVSSNDLAALLDQTLDLLRTDYDMRKHYDFKQIRIQREYDQAASSVHCEAGKLQQVFMNILKNGAEAMAETTDASAPPAFMLRVQDDGAWVRVEIEDNGPGMDEQTRRRIFEPFFTTKPAGKGTGLGLSVSYFIIAEDHGGEMNVQAGDGGGTCFVIRLPKGGGSGEPETGWSVVGDR